MPAAKQMVTSVVFILCHSIVGCEATEINLCIFLLKCNHMSRYLIIFSVLEDYFPEAAEELHEAFSASKIERLGPDVGRFEATGIDISDVAEESRRRPLIFVRHLMRELARFPLKNLADDLDEVYETALRLLESNHVGAAIALQVWRSGVSPLNYRPEELWHHLAEGLIQQGFSVARGGREQILTVLGTPKQLILGINRQEDALVDWPGGRLNLAKSNDQISRAEFKLEELLKSSTSRFRRTASP